MSDDALDSVDPDECSFCGWGILDEPLWPGDSITVGGEEWLSEWIYGPGAGAGGGQDSMMFETPHGTFCVQEHTVATLICAGCEVKRNVKPEYKTHYEDLDGEKPVYSRPTAPA